MNQLIKPQQIYWALGIPNRKTGAPHFRDDPVFCIL